MSRRHKGQWAWYNTNATDSRTGIGASGGTGAGITTPNGGTGTGFNSSRGRAGRSGSSLPDGVVLRVEHVVIESPNQQPSNPETPAVSPDFSADFLAGSFSALVEPGDAHTTALLLAMAGFHMQPPLSFAPLGAPFSFAPSNNGVPPNTPPTWQNSPTQTTAPAQQTATPTHQTTAPAQQTTIPAHQTTAPAQQTTIPAHPSATAVTSSGTVAMVLTHAAMIPQWTIEQNLRLAAAVAGQVLAGPSHLDIPQEFMELLGPLPALTTPVANVDEETLQRVALLRALLGRPQVLLVDHPAPRLASVLRVIADRARCAVIAATNQQDVASWADRVIVLKDGHFASESQVSPKSTWRTLFRRDPRPRPKVPDQVFAPAAPIPRPVAPRSESLPASVTAQPAPAQALQPDVSLTRPEPPAASNPPFAQSSEAASEPELPEQPATQAQPEPADQAEPAKQGPDQAKPAVQPATQAQPEPADQAEPAEQPAEQAELAESSVDGESEPASPTSETLPPPPPEGDTDLQTPAAAATAVPPAESTEPAESVEPVEPVESEPEPESDQSAEENQDYLQLVRRMPIVNEPDPVTQEIATMAFAQVQEIEKASMHRAAEPDPLRDELEQQTQQATSAIKLPKDSAQTVNQAQQILQALPGPVMPS